MDYEFGREANEGNLTVTIDHVKSFGDSISFNSAPTVIQTLPWKMTVSRRSELLSVKIVCNDNSASTLWNCSANIKVTALATSSHGEFVKMEEKTVTETLEYGKSRVTVTMDTGGWQGFAENAEKLQIDATISLTRVSGVRKRKIVDYSQEQPILFNGIVSVEGRNVHVNKQLLTMHSKFFENLFFGKFAETAQPVVELPDVKYTEFCEFLDIINPTRTEVNKSTVENLLKLADRFQTDEVAGRCEKFLMSTKDVTVAKKLILAQQYRLGELMDKCLKSFNSLEDMFPLRNSEFYHDINDDVKSALLERLIKIHQDERS